MNCQYVQTNIQSFIDQTMDFNHTELIEEHLHECAACSREYQSYKKLIAALNEADYPKLNDQQWQAIHSSIIAAVSSPPQKKPVILSIPVFTLFNSRYFPVSALAALIVVALISLAFLFPGHLRNQEMLGFNSEIYPKVVAINGSGNAFSMDVEPGNTTSRVPVYSDLTIPPGRSIETDHNASLQIQVDKRSTIQVGRNSNFSVAACAPKKTVLKLTNGDLAAQVGKRTPDQLFRIETPNAFCEVIGTRFNVTTQHDEFRDRFITSLTVQEGTVQFGSADARLYVEAGHSVAIFGDSLGIPTLSNDPLIRQLQQEPGRGLFTITSKPLEALVLIDGIPSGFTPLSGTAPFGKHTVTCLKKGFSRWTGAFEVEAHTKATLKFSLSTDPHSQNNTTTMLAANTTLDDPLLLSATELMIAGNYEKALVSLSKLYNNTSIPPAIRASALNKASTCHKYLRNYTAAITMLQRIIEGDFSNDERGNALFERATIYQTLLHDAKNALNDFRRYTQEFRDGIWAKEAFFSSAELLYLRQDYNRAAGEYLNYCDIAGKTSRCENALYRVAIIYSNNLSDPKRAVNTFTRLLLEFPQTNFAEDAVFWSADCLLRMGTTNRAIHEFNRYIQRYPSGKWLTEAKTRLKRIETAEVR
ncbi:MAG: FecR domain-containing protein [Chitinispirillaceae bacterium]|nr:FecR domain-containing protein [Chitinispirillaceae bacterium]